MAAVPVGCAAVNGSSGRLAPLASVTVTASPGDAGVTTEAVEGASSVELGTLEPSAAMRNAVWYGPLAAMGFVTTETGNSPRAMSPDDRMPLPGM